MLVDLTCPWCEATSAVEMAAVEVGTITCDECGMRAELAPDLPDVLVVAAAA